MAANLYSNLKDDELVLLVHQEEAAAFDEIYNRYWDKLFNSAYKRIKINEVCEEIVQEVCIKYWSKRHTFLSSGLSNYLYTATKYGVIDYYRKSLVRNVFYQESANDHQIDNSNEENIFIRDLIQHINHIVSELPPKCRQVYQLSREENKTNKEISRLLNISEKTVEGHLTKALYFIRQHIGDLSALLLLFLRK